MILSLFVGAMIGGFVHMLRLSTGLSFIMIVILSLVYATLQALNNL